MTPPAWPRSEPVPAALAAGPSLPPNAVFLDTNLAHPGYLRSLGGTPPLICALVFAELASRWPGKRRAVAALMTMLQDEGVRVVPVDANDVVVFGQLLNEVSLSAMKKLPDETPEDVLRRVRNDLLIYAVSLRHQRVLHTRNHADFRHFPRGGWHCPA